RRGMSLGEGAAVLILESWQHAVARGVPWRACVAGCGLSSDALHPTAPPTRAEGRWGGSALAAVVTGVGPSVGCFAPDRSANRCGRRCAGYARGARTGPSDASRD